MTANPYEGSAAQRRSKASIPTAGQAARRRRCGAIGAASSPGSWPPYWSSVCSRWLAMLYSAAGESTCDDPAALKTIIDQLPIGAIVMVLVAWGAGTLVGGFTAGAIAGRGAGDSCG